MSDLGMRSNDSSLSLIQKGSRAQNNVSARDSDEDQVAGRVNDSGDVSSSDKALEGRANLLGDASSGASIEEAAVKLEAFTQSINRDLAFRVDDSSGKTVVSVIDSETKEVIREVPGEDALRLSENIEEMRSLIFSVRV